MLKYILLACCYLPFHLAAQQELTQIEIMRDEWGVPHIYAPTDAEVCYGLAWAQCEDDFKTVQEQMLAVQGRYGEVAGKEGILVDFAVQFLGFREVVEAKYETDLSPNIKRMLEAYAEAVNSYAATHPEEVLLKGKQFAVTPHDLVVGYLLGVTQLTNTPEDLVAILNDKVKLPNEDESKGSNAIAISKRKTTSGETFLAINSHQPMEGWYSWYEAHLGSDEGWNMLGGTFPGGITIFHGTNEQLAWAHTVNHADFSDIFELKMHPTEDNLYAFDGKWLPLKEKKYKAKLKFGPLQLPIRRTIYQSQFGPTFRSRSGRYYALRFVSGLEIGAVEQWYNMNRATNLEEFQQALQQRGLVCTNIVYADEKDNIYYISNGKLPDRAKDFDWTKAVPATAETLWTNYLPIDSLPQVLNPTSGYLYNTNHTPFNATAEADNAIETSLNETMGYQTKGIENNRSQRFAELINQHEQLSWEDFKRIKFDRTYPQQLQTTDMQNLELILQLNPESYPDIAEAIELLNAWNRKTELDNTTAALFIQTVAALYSKLSEENRLTRGGTIKETDAVQAIRAAKQQLLNDYGNIQFPLRKMQRHIRGDVNLPMAGGPDVLASIYGKRQKNGEWKAVAGDCYIQLVRFGKEGVQIESINVYGASAKPESPHFTDQMQPFVEQELKPMTLDWEVVRKNAVRIYHPLSEK